MLSAKEKTIIEALEPYAQDADVEIVTVEIVGAKKAPTIRIYLDTESGVNFDVLASSQSWINRVIDEIDPFPGAYTLEVSSPGIDRPLRTPEHFTRFAQEDAVIKTLSPVGGRSSFTGVLKGLNADGDVVIETEDGQQVALAFGNIKRAHLKGKIDFNS